MKSNSCSKTAVRMLLAVALVAVSWPTTGHSQDSSRRDRYRRDSMDRKSSTRPGTGRPETTQAVQAKPGTTPAATAASKEGSAGRITKPAEPTRAPAPMARRARSDRGEQWAQYSLILDRNIFSRTRRGPQSQRNEDEGPRIVPNPESYFLLKGVVQEDNHFIAFVEDKRTGSVLRLREGDTVARGLVKSLTLDGFQYQFRDKTISVTMQSDLEGGSGALTAGDLASFSATAAPAASSTGTAAPSADEAEIIKRLMEQRQQQLAQ